MQTTFLEKVGITLSKLFELKLFQLCSGLRSTKKDWEKPTLVCEALSFSRGMQNKSYAFNVMSRAFNASIFMIWFWFVISTSEPSHL